MEPALPVSALEPLARQAMQDRGLTVDFPPEVLAEVARLGGPAPLDGVRDLRALAWASIDNEDTRDIDQLAFAEDLGGGRRRLLVAIADVASCVARDGELDRQAQRNTVTVYLPGLVKPMLPLQLSNDWTSLGPDVDRRAVVTELTIAGSGDVEASTVYEAAVRNRAKLDYVGVSSWADGGPAPAPLAGNEAMQAQMRLQLDVGRQLAGGAAGRGALSFEADRVLAVVRDGFVVDVVEEEKNQANEAVAHMMIAANTANAGFLHAHGFPVLQRAMPFPERWDRLRALAGPDRLPEGPDSAALERFLREEEARDPEGYRELSLAALKLIGSSDYVVTGPGAPLLGHFGQGISGGEVGYAHSTAPNRRYPDVLVQRLLKARLAGQDCPYSLDDLGALADRCNKMESAARGAERQVQKAAVSGWLATQIGARYPALVTGVAAKGTFVRVADPPIEGKLVEGADGADVGDRVTVELRAVDAAQGHIDFARVATDAPQAR